jgi:predicted PurR-regulated permease PerM
MFFLLSFIPGVGFLLAVIPPVLLALLEHDGLRALLVFVGCLLVDNIVDKAIKPRYMQEGLDLSILVIILSILFWSWVLGPTGAILSVPLTMMVKKLVLESSEETRFIALLMGAGNTEKVTTNYSASENENG